MVAGGAVTKDARHPKRSRERSQRASMIEAARQRAAVPKTRSSNPWLPVAVLAALATSAQAQQQTTNTAVPVQDAHSASPAPNRGVSAQAATSAATSPDANAQQASSPDMQVAQIDEKVDDTRVSTQVATPPADAMPAAEPMQAVVVRGVMFRITPPAQVALPAEAPQVQPLSVEGPADQPVTPAPSIPASAKPAD